jgi:penicillin-insensitive murein endopeptidase
MKTWFVVVIVLLPLLAGAEESKSRGTPAKGSLEGGVSFPVEGPGFITYSRAGHGLGRQYVHSRVHAAVLEAFKALHAVRPERVFVIGETGLRQGGKFWPHRTHQNGLSVDIFFPVVDEKGLPQVMPTGPTNKFGYSLEFDRSGKGEGLRIDFGATADLLAALASAGRDHGLSIQKVITAPEYVNLMLATPPGKRLGPLAQTFMRKPAWVRHDEHLHVDFALSKSAR